MSNLPLKFNKHGVRPEMITGFKIDGEVHLVYFDDIVVYNWLQEVFNLVRKDK